MTPVNADPDEPLIAEALRHARDTRLLIVETGARHRVGEVFASHFAGQQAIVVADANTLTAAAKDVCESLARARILTLSPFIFGPHLYADDRCAGELQAALSAAQAVPVAVGSGTINDLTKL